jgi:hypothetical protein
MSEKNYHLLDKTFVFGRKFYDEFEYDGQLHTLVIEL